MTVYGDEKWDSALLGAKKAYRNLIKRYPTPLDIPETDWIRGDEVEPDKWYLWVEGGDVENSSEQHLIMIPSNDPDFVNIKKYEVLWYFSDGNWKLFNTRRSGVELDLKYDWWEDEYLNLHLDDFGLAHDQYYVVGPLFDSHEKEENYFFNYINWSTENPLGVKE